LIAFTMDQSAVDVAFRNLTKAIASLEALKKAGKAEEFYIAWSDFLTAANRVFSKLEQGAKISGQSKAWFGRKIHERRTDPLLSYLHHARNADEHGLAPSPKLVGHKLGAPRIEQVVTPGIPGRRGVPTTIQNMVFVPVLDDLSSAQLFAVVDRGVTYNPPTQHLGLAVQDTSPIAIAELAISFLRSLTDEARKLPLGI
jgi:hypothetical protein